MTNKGVIDFSKLSKKDFPFRDRLDRDQEDMVIKLFRDKRVFVNSISGSGKTTIATQAMKVLLDKGIIDKVYYVVFPVQEESLGYLPGGVSDKIKEYAIPFMQALIKAGVNPQGLDLDRMCNEEVPTQFNVVPATYLRGRNISNAGIILDEAQNGTADDLKKTLTRIEDDCYSIIAGHTGQIDIEKKLSGFSRYIHHFKQGKESGEFTEVNFADLRINHRGAFSTYADGLPE